MFFGSKAVKRRSLVPQIDKDTPILTVAELKRLLTVLTSLFDVARIVNPYDTAVLSIKDDGRVEGNPYTCFKVWGKHQRCANCTSREADISHCRKDKYEYVKTVSSTWFQTPLPTGMTRATCTPWCSKL